MLRTVVVIIFLAVLCGATFGAAASVELDGGILQVFSYAVDIEIPPISAEVDIKPESLQKKSAGQPVIAFIELPQEYDVTDIDVATVRLCLGTAPCAGGVASDGAPGATPEVGDHDGDGIADLKISFGRCEVIALVSDVPAPVVVTFTVSGKVGPYIFAGSDTVRLIND